MSRCAKLLPLGAALLLSCAQPQPAAMNQSINMGAFSFSVSGTEESAKTASQFEGGSWHRIPITQVEIHFRVTRDDTKPFTTDFASFFLASMSIKDAAGNWFDLGLRPVQPTYSAGRYRSSEYIASVRLDPTMMGVRDAKHLGTHAQDFELSIKNPDRQAGQPSRVTINLR